MSELILIPAKNPSGFVGRLYYKDSYNNLYCLTGTGGWFHCSRDGEPQSEVPFTITGQEKHIIRVYEDVA